MTNAATMTYDSLVSDIEKYSERVGDEDFQNQIPRLIMLSENKIAAEIKTLWETTIINTLVTQGQSSIPKPTRWRKTISMKVTPTVTSTLPGTPVLIRDQTFVSLYGSEADAGQPLYYSDWDYQNWLIAPVPDQTYRIEIGYQGRVQPLDTSNQINLITTECPQLLLYGSMVEACMYLKSFEKLQIWQPLYQSALEALKNEDLSRFVDKNTKREV